MSGPEKADASPLRGKARRDAILFAAMALMAERGAGRISMADVAAKASASKETVYRHFGDRTGLFIAVLARFAELQLASCPPAPKSESLEAGLKRLGRWYLDMALQRDVLSFYRYVAGTTEQTPGLGEAFTRNVTQPILEEIESFLALHTKRRDISMLAQVYLGMLQGKLWNRALVEPEHVIEQKDIATQVNAAAKLLRSALDPA